AVRLAAICYYRTHRDQCGQRNIAMPSSAYTAFTVTVPNGPGGTVAAPKPTTVTVSNVAASLSSAQTNIRDNEACLDTNYKGVALTRASQTVILSQRGDERYNDVTMVDLRLSRKFRLGTRGLTPTVDFFNVGNANTVVSQNVAVGGTYLSPSEILAPRIIRVG